MINDMNYNIKMETLTPTSGRYALYDDNIGGYPTILVEEIIGWATAIATPKGRGEEEKTIVGVVMDEVEDIYTPQSVENFLGYVSKEQLDRLAQTHNLEYGYSVDIISFKKFRKYPK